MLPTGIAPLSQGDPGHAAFIVFARGRLQPPAVQLGWDPLPNEQANAASVRNALLVALSRLGDQQVIAEARRRYESMNENPRQFGPAERRTALSIVARNADAATLERLIAKLRATVDPLEKQNTLQALTGVADEPGARRVLDLTVSCDAPAGTAPEILAAVAGEHPNLAWEFALLHVGGAEFSVEVQSATSE